MDVNSCMKEMRSQMEKTVSYFQNELTKIRAGKASPSMLQGVMVECYGASTPLEQVASVNTQDASSIVVQPWDKNLIAAIEKAILVANLGFTPNNNGEVVRVPVPPLTEERRKELVKQVKAESENAKIGIRNARRDGLEMLKKMEKEGLSEDLKKNGENDLQKLTDSFIERIEQEVAKKEKEIMTV